MTTERGAAFALRDRFDPIALAWPGVRRRYVFGWPAYTLPGSLFAMFGEDEIVVNVSDALRDALLAGGQASEWVPPGSGMRSFGDWIAVPIAGQADDELAAILEDAYLRAAGHLAMGEPLEG